MKKLIKYYNDNQSEIKVINIDNKNVTFNHNPKTGNYQIYKIGFYEWLFNPKYKVFEVFGLDAFERNHILNGALRMNTEEIIKYLTEQIEEK